MRTRPQCPGGMSFYITSKRIGTYLAWTAFWEREPQVLEGWEHQRDAFQDFRIIVWQPDGERPHVLLAACNIRQGVHNLLKGAVPSQDIKLLEPTSLRHFCRSASRTLELPQQRQCRGRNLEFRKVQ